MAGFLPEEPQGVIGPPAAMAYPFAEEVVFPGDEESGMGRDGHRLAYLLPQFGRDPLIGIQDEDPLKGRAVDGVLLLCRIALRAALIELVGVSAADLGGPVCAERIDDDDFPERA